MDKDQTIRVLLDVPQPPEFRGAFSGSDLGRSVSAGIDVSVDALKLSVQDTLKKVLGVFEELRIESSEYDLDSICLSLAIEASGAVSLIGLTKGSLTGKTGIEVTIARRRT